MFSFERLKSPSKIILPVRLDEQKTSLVPCEENVLHLEKTYTPQGYIPCDRFIQPSPSGARVEERKMAYCCLRSFITLLHLSIAAAAAFVCIYSIIGWNSTVQCLPQLFNKDRTNIPYRNGLSTVCDFVVFGLSAISLINLLMSVIVNIRWIHTCVVYFNLLLMLLFGAILVFGSSMFTIHYMIWCDSMQQINNESCSVSAQLLPPAIDTPMSSYKHRLELQQITMWAMYPVSLVLVLAYILALRLATVSTDTPANDQSGSYRYVVMREETAPLLPPTYQSTYNSNLLGQSNSHTSNLLGQSNSHTSDYWSSRAPSVYSNVASNRPSTPAIPRSTSPTFTRTDDVDAVARVRSQTGNSNLNPFT